MFILGLLFMLYSFKLSAVYVLVNSGKAGPFISDKFDLRYIIGKDRSLIPARRREHNLVLFTCVFAPYLMHIILAAS